MLSQNNTPRPSYHLRPTRPVPRYWQFQHASVVQTSDFTVIVVLIKLKPCNQFPAQQISLGAATDLNGRLPEVDKEGRTIAGFTHNSELAAAIFYHPLYHIQTYSRPLHAHVKATEHLE